MNVDDLNERLDRARKTIQSAIAATEQEVAASRTADREAEGRRAAAARRGEFGADWTRIQQRIDLNQTTLDAVFSGEDESPEARRLREQSRAGIAARAAELRERSDDEDDPLAAEFGAVAAIRGDIDNKLETIRRFLAEGGGGHR